MRERTPSADDTPKRAPPAPNREAAVAGSETPNDEDTIEVYRTAKLPGLISSESGATSSSDKMVASMQSLEDLAVNHPANATGSNGDRQQQQQERYCHAYRSSAQIAQDKRSRLSNVINNLRKKVPDGNAKGNAESSRKEEDDRNSVERNLETLEKYVMTVLNGVIKDDEEEDKRKNAEKAKEPERRRKDLEEEETGTTVKFEPSNESDIEAAVVPCLEDSSTVENAESSKITDYSNTKGLVEESVEISEIKINQDLKERRMKEEHVDVEKEESSENNRDISRERKENRTLGTIIMDRLSEHQVEEKANVDDGRGKERRDERVISENMEVRTICIELLDELLNDVYLMIDNQKSQQKVEECEKMKSLIDTESKVEEIKDSNSVNVRELKSLHCSLPLDKIAFVLQNYQINESMTSRLSSGLPSNSPSIQKSKSSPCATSSVRLLCLYCDRKFLSMSLRQRHTERVHQLGGGRRSERNLRKPFQNCQYCSEKCADTLETLFQHMISNHGDKYHACVQCLTRYSTREALMGHISEAHGGSAERTTSQVQLEKIKEASSCKEFCNHEMVKMSSERVRERRFEEKELETNQDDSQSSDNTQIKLIATRDSIDNPASPEFDSSFYSNVSCNIRENLLHHLDGKLQTIGGGSSSCASSITVSSTTSTESKSQQQSYYEHSVNQIQFPIDISLTAATPVYNKDYSASEEYENSSEYARKAGKTSSGSRPRRVSFEKYNFPRKYDGKEQWTCSIKDLSKFDISTQLSLRKKQQLIKERLTISRLNQIPLLSCEITEVSLCDREQAESVVETTTNSKNNIENGDCNVDVTSFATLDVVRCDPGEPPPTEIKKETTIEESSEALLSCLTKTFITTEFTVEFADFMRLRRREQNGNEAVNVEKIIYAELSGEWSRTRIYICGACGSKHMTLKEMEDHKASTHPRVLCSHFELTGDQREHYKHLYLPGQNAPTDEARDATLAETPVCTKCTKSCVNVAELHRHMLECGGDHAWLLGLIGSGKRKCKWRPFGSRSRRRRQRGMKRNIQNSQTQPRIVNAERPKEKQTPTGPRIRPSDRESIQKMLANLPPKRTTRKVLQDNAMRSQSKLRNVQTRTRPRIIGDNSSVSRISRNKAALRNKLLKNAKSIQRNRCRSDNITAVIESVVKKCHETEKKSDVDDDNKNTETVETEDEYKKDAKEINEILLTSKVSNLDDKIVRPKVGRPKIFGKKGNMKTKTGNSVNNSQFQNKTSDNLENLKAKSKFVKFKSSTILKSDAKGEEKSSSKITPKNSKTTSRTADKDISPDSQRISTVLGIRSKSKLTQGILKRKRPVDPVVSLNASLKAKLQLRTQDGKFARNPNKNSSSKLSEMKIDDGKHKATNSVEIKLLKSKTIQKLKKAEVKLPRRITRLSSDSDKMPTLEPIMQIVSSNEEYADKSTNDLPILLPVTSSESSGSSGGSLQDQKTLRISAKYILKEKESNTEINTDRGVASEKSAKEQKSTRGRKPKQESKVTTKQKEVEIIGENEISKNSSIMLKERRSKNRKSLPIKNINNSENSKEETSKGEIIAKKDSKPKKEEITKETRSNSKTRIEKDSMKLAIPFEVKKLLGSASKEDLLNTLELASNDTGSKRNLRQSTPRLKMLQANNKNFQELDDESDSSKGIGKREKIETVRKSSRKNVEKKSDDKIVKTINLEKDSVNNAITKDISINVAHNEKNQQSKKGNRTNGKTKEIDNTDIENKIDNKQIRKSMIDTSSDEPSLEVANVSSQKDSDLFEKCYSQPNKPVDKAEEINTSTIEKQNNNENVTSSEKETQKKKKFEEAVDRNEIEDNDNSNSDDRDSTMVNLGLSHLQSETSNLSVDSGKENSLETSVNIHNKLKVARPKKTWGARRERSSRKRSLNNVIGILTEGINIPVEQNVQVLTVQTSLDNPDRVTRNGSTQQSVSSDSNMIAVDSAFSEISVLARSEQEPAENEVITTNENDNHCVDNEKNVRSCTDKAQDENVFIDQINMSSKVSTAKVYSPTNDIILDLSRRKPKGKGSFLEKIVSKIAKQKDALLEGEVGSLLDNAADELTSILDEVGPALADNAENANFDDEISYTSKNENNENITSKFIDKKSPTVATPDIRSLENDITNIKSVVSERSMDLLVIQDNFEDNLVTKIETQIQSRNQNKINDVSNVEIKDNYVVDRQVSDTMRSMEESQVESCKNKLATNEEAIIPMEIPDETPSSLTDTLTEISISSITSQKLNVEELEKKENDVKSRRKSIKRSLEDVSWSKKSKRKSLENVEELTEKNMQEDLRLDVIVSKQKKIFNIGHELVEKETMKVLKIDGEIKKQNSENKNIKNIDLLGFEKILAEDDESNLEKLATLPEAAYEEANELTASLEEAVDKIISNGEAVETNAQSIKLIEESIESSVSLKKIVKNEKSTNRILKKNQTDDANETSYRDTSKRKSQSFLDIFQSSIKPVNEEKLFSSFKEDFLDDFTDEKSMKIGSTNENSNASSEKSCSMQKISKEYEEIQNVDDSSLVDSMSSKTKKYETKKTLLADEHLDLSEDESAKTGLNFNEELNITDSNEQLSASLEHFKIPEVKTLLQNMKKRNPKKKFLEDDRYGENVSEEFRINEELSEMSNLIEKVESQIECKKHNVREQLRTKKLERSSSSDLIRFIPGSLIKTRSMFKKRIQLSSEDLVVSSICSHDAESTDELSESSCTSESSYFRKKRFVKKKKKEENIVSNNKQTNLIILKSDKENLKQNAKLLLDEQLDFSDVDDIDIPMDIQTSLENRKALENMEREFELAEKSLALQDEDTNDKSMIESTKDIAESVSNNNDSPDDSITPKKRAAGNFVVVHTKTGEILIVEKRKKLTKEAARFFCDVCATSFTRKSSLKKHTLSQSHLSQMTKSTKDKIEFVNNGTSENIKQINDIEKNNQMNDQNAKNVLDDVQSHEVTQFQKSLESNESYIPYGANTESLDLGETRQETLEDKLLDEEICKITENMSHDEYVLTDQVTPDKPMSSSTPVKQIQKKQEELEQDRNDDKKHNKSKKKNLAEEHLILDSPELNESKFDSNEPLNSVNNLEWSSFLPSSEHSSTKEIVQTMKEVKDVSEEIQYADSAEPKNQIESSIVKSLNDEINCSKLSSCDTDMKVDHMESTRTTRSSISKKFCKIDNDKKEENQTSTEITRFTLRPRRSKNIQHYGESDVETDVYFMDASIEINNDEIENNCNLQKRQNEMEKEIIKNALPEMAHADSKNKEGAEIAKSKPDSTNDIKKRKRGRPRLKDRIIPNSNVTLAHTEFEVNENNVAVTKNFEESKNKDQKIISHIKEHLGETGKALYIDANIQPFKRSRGRPRKNPVQIANNFLTQAGDSTNSESIKSKCKEIREKTEQIKTEMLLKKTASITLVESLTSNVESLPDVEELIRESNLSEIKKEELNIKESKIQLTRINISENQLKQKIESTNIEISDTILKKNCDMLTFNVSEKSKTDDASMLTEMNVCADDTKYQSENKSDHNDTSANILTIEKVSIDDLKSAESVKSIRLNENFEIQKLPNISEEKQTKSREELSEVEIFQEETKLVSESEDSEDKITDDKSLLITNPHKLLTQKTNDLENDNIRDKKTTRSDSSKRLFGNSQSIGKERETDRKKSKASRGRKKKITAKIAELSSDSENEIDKIESASSSKNKIVKCVFGRVFGGEKADKVKEVLNDWVSRSEDDSDKSRSASEARSCLRGRIKISENEHKKDKKRHSGILIGSDTKKNAELSPRKNENDSNERRNEKDSNIEVHGKLKNRKKREKDFFAEDCIESLSPINSIKRRHRKSKIRADERLLRSFDDEPLIFSEDNEYENEIKEINNQFDNDYLSNKNESERYCEEEPIKDRNLIFANCENLQIDQAAYKKSKNSSNYRKKQDINASNERSSSPSQFNMFKCRQRMSKIKAAEGIRKTLEDIASCFSWLDATHKNFKKRKSGFHESRNADRSNNSKNIKHKNNDTWENINLINQEQIEAQNTRGRSRKDSNNRKKQNFNVIEIGETKTDNVISKKSDNNSLIALRNQKTKNETQNDQTTRSTSESKKSKNLIIKDNTCESFTDMNHYSVNSRKNKKGIVNEDWKCSVKNLEFNQEDFAKDNQSMEKENRQKHEIFTTLSRSYSNLAGSIVKDQFADLDDNSQTIRESDNDDNNDEEEEQENDDDDDNDLGRQRISPFYACETPNSSIESSSNNEEDEEEDGEEDEEEKMTHEDISRKTNPSEFSGEKIIIRSPSSGHRSDVVTIAPTDAIEDNALDVPREIESTTELRQGKILNFDEELFVECCSRLKATSENELRGAKKIKLDHTEFYHRRDDQPQGFRVNRDRWRDVESQNSLGSLLESVNQLLGEEMCNSHDRSYRRGSEQSSRSASPDTSRVDNLGYEDSLDVAFEHNNKLRDKIQQRMRESENLIASTFGQKTNDNDHSGDDKRGNVGNLYSSSMHEHEQSISIALNRERVPSPGHKNKMNSTLGGLLDKALSNLLHSNSKHDHNGSAPMKLLAELACARAPTSTSSEDTINNGKNHQSVKMVAVAVAAAAAAAATKDTLDLSKKPTKGSMVTSKTSLTNKKIRNPIKELFERKKEINDRKEQQERSKALVELNVQKLRKPKKGKKQQQQEFPLIRRNDLYGGLMEKKKRRDSFDRKGELDRIKDVYEFDEEESQTAPTLGSVMSYRSQIDKNYDTNWLKKDIDGDFGITLENEKANYIADTKLGVIINRKFQELEKFAPKTKGALKSFQSEEQQQQVADSITGPMDDFVERKHQRLKRLEQNIKQSSKLKKRSKSLKKRARNAWYENDSSDEFRTAAKAEDVGVGISKSQRACSKGKQNLFAELSTSSESEYEREDDVDYANEQQPLSSSRIKHLNVDIDEMNSNQHIINDSKFDNENQIANCDWQNQATQKNAVKKDYDIAKSESEMSDRSLIIDERKTIDEARNSDDDADNQYERTFELEDLYREDSSETETEIEGNEELISTAEETKDRVRMQELDDENAILQTKVTPTNVKDDYAPENELIPLEEALDLLDQHENLESKSDENVCSKVQIENESSITGALDIINEISNDGIINMEKENKHLDHIEAQDEKEEPDDDIPALPEKLSSNEKPQKESDNNLPLHVFLSRKVQESKKRKQQQLDKLREEQERILMDFQPTRRQRKCAIGKQGLLAEISSSDEESYVKDNSKKGNDYEKSRKKRESKEKKKERYLEKKHEQMIAKEQKAIEEEILREVGKRKEILAQNINVDSALNINAVETKVISMPTHKKKHQSKEKQKKSGNENIEKNMQHTTNQSSLGSSEDIYNLEHAFSSENIIENNGHLSISPKRKKLSKSPLRLKKTPKPGENGKISASKKNKELNAEKSKKISANNNKDLKERRSSSGKRDSDDEELKTTKSWNKVEEGVGVAIGRRKRTAAFQLYYWSSSSDEEEAPEPVMMPKEEEDDRQEQHGWIVGDSHKRMITMLAMEKQQKEKRRRSEDEFESGKSKSKKHRNSTS